MLGIGTIGLVVRNAPAIVRAAVKLEPFLPGNWRGALNKVKTGAVVAGGLVTTASQPWDAETAVHGLSLWALTWAGVPAPEPAMLIAPILATVATFLGGTAATYITGWATREDAARLDQVEATA